MARPFQGGIIQPLVNQLQQLQQLQQQQNTPTIAPIKPPVAQPTDGGLDITQPLTPQQLAELQTAYDQRAGQYNALQSDYDRGLRMLDYSKRTYDRSNSLWDQLERQRMAGGGYGSNRYYTEGEIYNYDPTTGTYRGSLSGMAVGAPSEYVAPTLPTAPIPYADYMADDPYYQILQDSTNPNFGTVGDVAPPVDTGGDTGSIRPPKPPAVDAWIWKWDEGRGEWVKVRDDDMGGPK